MVLLNSVLVGFCGLIWKTGSHKKKRLGGWAASKTAFREPKAEGRIATRGSDPRYEFRRAL